MKNNQTEKTTGYYYAEGVLTKKTEYIATYDQDNKLIKRENKEFDGSGKLLLHEVIENKNGETVKTYYDENGNVIKPEDNM